MFGNSERMTQDDINFQEWSDPANWSTGWCRAYFSKRDSRVWVPKRPPGSRDEWLTSYPAFSLRGATINFGNPRGKLWLTVLCLIPIAALSAVLLLAVRGH